MTTRILAEALASPPTCLGTAAPAEPVLGIEAIAALAVSLCTLLGVAVAMLMWSQLRGWRPPPKAELPACSRLTESTGTVNATTPEATASNVGGVSPSRGDKGDETGAADAGEAAWTETGPESLALARRVRALGLFLGDVCVSGYSLGLPNGGSARKVLYCTVLSEWEQPATANTRGARVAAMEPSNWRRVDPIGLPAP